MKHNIPNSPNKEIHDLLVLLLKYMTKRTWYGKLKYFKTGMCVITQYMLAYGIITNKEGILLNSILKESYIYLYNRYPAIYFYPVGSLRPRVKYLKSLIKIYEVDSKQ